MKILAVSDEECPAFWDYYIPGRLKDYDLIISAGDLKASYLSFLVTVGHAPVFYVHGNHDTGYEQRPPEGCDDIDGRLIIYNGLRIVGLGGCRKYHEGAHQYTERQMQKRMKKLRWDIIKAGGVDIVVTHAPPLGVGDAEDNAHRGFETLLDFIDQYHPVYLLHGHVHLTYGQDQTREREYHGTRVINCYERYTFDIEPKPEPRGIYGKCPPSLRKLLKISY